MQLLGDIDYRSLLGKKLAKQEMYRVLCFRLAKQTMKHEARSHQERDVNATRFFVHTMFWL